VRACDEDEPDGEWYAWVDVQATGRPDVLVGQSGPESILCDNPPESMPESRPLLGFRLIER
jgi:hypothetical protein